jgi:hypothetical protein
MDLLNDKAGSRNYMRTMMRAFAYLINESRADFPFGLQKVNASNKILLIQQTSTFWDYIMSFIN